MIRSRTALSSEYLIRFGSIGFAEPLVMDPRNSKHVGRRQFLLALSSGAALVFTDFDPSFKLVRKPAKPSGNPDKSISPVEDLMREHGVLERLLLIFEECVRQFEGRGPAPLDVTEKGMGIMRRFIEDYHERLEEEFVFPRFEAAGREIELVATLKSQHTHGRALTDWAMQLVSSGDGVGSRAGLALPNVLRSFSRMFRPHMAREDTVLFPAFQEIIGGTEACRELGEQLEKRENTLFGEHGFEDIVKEIAVLEKILGINDLARFTEV